MSSFRMTNSMYISNHRSSFNLNEVHDKCRTMGIKLQRNPDGQLESAYSMQGFKVIDENTNGACYIFVSILDQGSLNVSSFYNGESILKKTISNQSQIPQFVRSSLQVINQNVPKNKNFENQYREMQELYEKLNKISENVLKTAKSQMMAVQQIKSSKQYMQVCNHQKLLSLQIQELCKTVKARENKTNMRNQGLINIMLQVENQKQLLQENLYKYSELVKHLSDVQGFLNKFIAQKKQQLEGKDFYDQQSFNKYLQDLTEIKKLQNQKKYLSHI